MIEVTIGKKVYQIEETMTVEQYQRIQLNKIFLEQTNSAKLLALYIGCSESELKNAKKSEIDFIEAYIFKRLTDGVTKDMIFTFEIDGVTYGFENDWSKLAWGAWKDLEFLSSQDITENIHKILSVLYRPVTEEKGTKYKILPYDADTVEQRAEIFKRIPVKIWFGSAQLFFFISQTYINGIKSSLESKMKIQKLIQRGMKVLPKWFQRKLLRDFISTPPSNSAKMI